MKTKTATEAFKAYAVLIRCKDGREFLAHSGTIGPRLLRKRKDALQYADELAEHVGPRRRLKVVSVFAKISYWATK